MRWLRLSWAEPSINSLSLLLFRGFSNRCCFFIKIVRPFRNDTVAMLVAHKCHTSFERHPRQSKQCAIFQLLHGHRTSHAVVA